MPAETAVIQQAFRFALDPTPRQARMMASHAGARRYVANWTHARVSAAAQARQEEKDAGQEAVTVIPGRFELGPEWTRFKNTAVGCRRCRGLLVRGPGGVWADDRSGSAVCGDDGAAPHDPTAVTCRRCATVLHEADGAWRGGDDSAVCLLHKPADDFGNDGEHENLTCQLCGTVLQRLHPDGRWRDNDGSVACKLHEPRSEFLAWTGEVFIGTIQAAIRDVAEIAWPKFLSGKTRRPKFKKKGKSPESFQVHGSTLRLQDAVHVTLPKIGTVTAMSDDSLHPAMTCSRSRTAVGSAMAAARLDATRRKLNAARQEHQEAVRAAGGQGAGAFGFDRRRGVIEQLEAKIARLIDAVRTAAKVAAAAEAAAKLPGSRHMGNRRRSRHLWREVCQTPGKASELGPLLRRLREDAGLRLREAVDALNAAADARASAAETAKAATLLEAAAEEIAAAQAAGPDESGRNRALDRGRAHARYAQKKHDNAPGKTAKRTDAWSQTKLTTLETTGVCTGLEQASVICAAYRVSGDQASQVMALAAQARTLRATISLGADGLWWCSVSADVPCAVRFSRDQAGEAVLMPSRAQRNGGVVGVDFGVRQIATCSDGTTIANPHHLDSSLAQLQAAQRALSRCQPGSKRRAKARQRVGLIHADIARQRSDGLQRATTELLRRHAVVAVEGWNIQEAARYRRRGRTRVTLPDQRKVPASVRRRRNRALADAAIGMARQMISYKGERFGVRVMVTSPGAATGRTCSVDGLARTTPLPPYYDEFVSDRCDHRMDRRDNSARALARWAQQELSRRGPAPSGPARPRRGDVRPATGATTSGGRRSPLKRSASARPRPG